MPGKKETTGFIEMIDLPEALRNLEKIRGAGENRWQACCPCHEDNTPSLTITISSDKILLHCHAGCSTENIVASLGLEMKDLFLDEPLQKATRNETEYRYTDESGAYLYSVVRIESPGNKKTFRVKTAAGYGFNGARRVL